MRGADILAEALAREGCQTVFALSGNQIMPIFDALLDHPIRLIHTRHEAAAVFMAEGFAQVSGQTGVALVTAGGGIGNVVGALIAARASDTPLVLISGDSPVAQDGTGSFQEVDQIAMTTPVVKEARRVEVAEDLAEVLSWAFERAAQGRPGPVHLAVPADVITQEVTAAPEWPQPKGRAIPDLEYSAFLRAKNPLLILGPALSPTRVPNLLSTLQEKLGAPAVVMESPRGLDDPSLGAFRDIAQEADHVLCLGKPIDFSLGFGLKQHWPNATKWDVVLGDGDQLKTAMVALGDRLQTGLHADPLLVANQLSAGAVRSPYRMDWLKSVAERLAKRQPRKVTNDLVPQDICDAVQTFVLKQSRAILVADGGEFGQWAQASVFAPRRVINGVSGIIGGGLCYAAAARAADPAATVIALMGDGTVGFHLSEFETAARESLPFIAVIGNDRRWNAEHQIQVRDFGQDRTHNCDLSGARYDQAVEALGGFGAYVKDKIELSSALCEALRSGLPACINVEMSGKPAPKP